MIIYLMITILYNKHKTKHTQIISMMNFYIVTTHTQTTQTQQSNTHKFTTTTYNLKETMDNNIKHKPTRQQQR